MKRQVLTCALTLALGLSLGQSAFAVSGPLQTPLKVTYIYTVDANGALYVHFQAGAMPGCYGNAGGYLLTGNTFFKEIYAQLLMMVSNGGIQAAVIYTQNTPTNNWGDCTITGISLQPQ